MSKRWRTIAICAGVIVLFSLGYALLSRFATGDEDADLKTVKLSTFLADDVAGLYYEYKNKAYYFSRQQGGPWVYLGDPEFPLDQELIRAMTRRIEGIRSSRRIGDLGEKNYHDMGFDNPTVVVKAIAFSGQDIMFTVGGYNDVISHYYMVIGGSPQIHILEQGFVDAFKHELYDLILKDPAPEYLTSSVESFNIYKNGETTYFQYYQDGLKSSYSKIEQWFITNDHVSDFPAGSSYVFNYLAYTGAGLELDACVLYNASPEVFPMYGLDDPVIVTVDYEDKDGRKAVIRYFIGDKVGEQYYLMHSDSDKIYLVSALIGDTLVNADPMAFRSDAIMLIKIETVNRFTIVSGKERYVFDLKHEEIANIDGSVRLQTSWFMDGVELPDDKALEFYKTFYYEDAEITLPASARTDEAPFLTIEFERNTEGFEFMTLEFAPYDPSYYLVRFNGRSDQLMGVRKVQGILNAARAFAKNK